MAITASIIGIIIIAVTAITAIIIAIVTLMRTLFYLYAGITHLFIFDYQSTLKSNAIVMKLYNASNIITIDGTNKVLNCRNKQAGQLPVCNEIWKAGSIASLKMVGWSPSPASKWNSKSCCEWVVNLVTRIVLSWGDKYIDKVEVLNLMWRWWKSGPRKIEPWRIATNESFTESKIGFINGTSYHNMWKDGFESVVVENGTSTVPLLNPKKQWLFVFIR